MNKTLKEHGFRTDRESNVTIDNKIRYVVFEDIYINFRTLKHFSFRYCTFVNCKFDVCMTWGEFFHCKFDNCTLRNRVFNNTSYHVSFFSSTFLNCQLHNLFNHCDFGCVTFAGNTIISCYFSKCSLLGAKFKNTISIDQKMPDRQTIGKVLNDKSKTLDQKMASIFLCSESAKAYCWNSFAHEMPVHVLEWAIPIIRENFKSIRHIDKHLDDMIDIVNKRKQNIS